MFLIDVPIFLTASVSVAVFYICAQRELHPRTWMKEILLLPCCSRWVSAFRSTTHALCSEAVFNHQSDFARTPKYGIERKAQPWRKCKYMPLKSLLPIAEMGFALYFSYFVWFAIQHGQYLSLPFLAMFQAGFLYVSVSSLSQWWPRFTLRTSAPKRHVPA